ncbi:MAG: sulfur reduction protein DsrE [Bacteroidetes bacterium]|nr:MAG: sulfur reduction protein DsrE [Bacteroidota bacterium]
MKLAIILSTNNAEKNWNALRLGNLALKNGDNVSIFLLGEGVEYLKFSSDKFDIQKQIDTFLESEKGEILACETCMVIRYQKGDKTCPVSDMKELYNLIRGSDKVVTF